MTGRLAVVERRWRCSGAPSAREACYWGSSFGSVEHASYRHEAATSNRRVTAHTRHAFIATNVRFAGRMGFEVSAYPLAGDGVG